MTQTSMMEQPLKVAVIQLSVGSDKQVNLKNAESKILEAVKQDAKLVVLPECFQSPYSTDKFREFAEPIPSGETTMLLSALAKQNNVFIVGGSIPEIDAQDDRVYNTSAVFDPNGEMIAKHRKVHLFDMDIPNGVYFKESDTLSSGTKATEFELDGFGHCALCICYDLRFPEIVSEPIRATDGFLIIVPAAFNLSTGPKHWDILAKCRAVDNECYVVMCSPARSKAEGAYKAYGHSMVVDPWGDKLVEAGEDEEIVYCEIDGRVMNMMRSAIPLKQHRRSDVYHTKCEKCAM